MKTSKSPALRHVAGLLLCVPFASSIAGEIPGLPAQLPPTIDRDLDISFINDFMGRGGSSDDFRTQQLIASARFADRWIATLDHSILTRNSVDLVGRIDQVSASAGYALFNASTGDEHRQLFVGAGFRSVGEFAGERLQNGFHRLFFSKLTNFPYSDTRRTDATAWATGDWYKLTLETDDDSAFAGWSGGFWLRGNALVTSDGQVDSAAAAFAVARNGDKDLWIGLRQDWRSGYSDPILRDVATEEQDLAISIGARFGPLIIETVQQLNNDASYGQIRLISSREATADNWPAQPEGAIELSFIVPDVHAKLGGRLSPEWLQGKSSNWRRSVTADIRFGEPQQGNDPTVYIRSVQLTAGLEWERTSNSAGPWMSWYAGAGIGWRRETPLVQMQTSSLSGSATDRVVLSVDAGMRFRAARLGRHWKYRIQTGLSAWVPTSDASRTVDGTDIRVQEPAIGLNIGMAFDSQ